MANIDIIEIYKVEAEKYNKTRDIQWKMNIGFWTVLIVAIYAKMKNELSIELWQEIISGAIFLILHFFFILHIHGSLKRSLNRMYNLANFIIEGKEKENLNFKNFEKEEISLGLGWHILQSVVTIALILIFIFLKR